MRRCSPFRRGAGGGRVRSDRLRLVLSAVALTPMVLSLVLAVFLVVGAFASMLATSDVHWWRDNLSALGMSSNSSSVAFNATLIIAGVMVTTIAGTRQPGSPPTIPPTAADVSSCAEV